MNLMRGLTNAFESLSIEARELYLTSEVAVLPEPPSALQFYREWVSPNVPVLIKNSTNHWSALKFWNSDYFREKIGDKDVTVAVTPNGYADAVSGDRFVVAEERTMKFRRFLDILDQKPEEKEIFYIQKQNSNFTEEFSEIIDDAELEIPWASEAFGKSPDAVNFWMGDGRAVTSMHKDHYENLYCVVSGTKTFTLLPPTDLPFIPHGLYKPAKYQLNAEGDFEIIDITENCDTPHTHVSDDNDSDNEEGDIARGKATPWISIDPLNPDLKTFPEYAKARPITCSVSAGETLYLPSLWFHHVQQSHKCIAVNFWYDMDYDIKYSYFKFLEKLTKLVKN